jgi:hypothetical protein
MDHDGDIGPSVRTTGNLRINGDIVHSVNLINVSRTSEDNVDSSGSTPDPPLPVYDPDHLP